MPHWQLEAQAVVGPGPLGRAMHSSCHRYGGTGTMTHWQSEIVTNCRAPSRPCGRPQARRPGPGAGPADASLRNWSISLALTWRLRQELE
jgi:hypothetical protein